MKIVVRKAKALPYNLNKDPGSGIQDPVKKEV